MAYETAPGLGEGPEPPRPMFGNLIASKPPRAGKGAVGATVTSLMVHAAILGALTWATMAVGKDVNDHKDQVELLSIKDEPPPPPPPPPPPELPKTPPPKELVEAPKGFQTLAPPTVVPPDIPPPKAGPAINEADFSGEGVAGGRADGNPAKTVTAEDVEAAPTFTPYTVKPELKNRDEFVRTLVREYPPMLRDAGVGGTVLMWILIDETGNVLKTQVKQGSGHDALDAAARKVAQVMRFTPALNRDQKVKVWVSIPIVFKAES